MNYVSGSVPRRPSTSWALLAGAVALVAALVALAVFVLSADPDADRDPTAAVSGAPAASQSPATAGGGQATAGSGDAGAGSDAGGSGSGAADGGDTSGDTGGSDGGGNGGGDGDGAEPPYIRDLYPDAFIAEGEEGEQVLTAIMQGHAFDPAGPDEQERVARLDIEWGDGATSTARLEGHGAFRDYHEYDPSYQGETVTVRVIAHGHDGRTATETVTLALPTQ